MSNGYLIAAGADVAAAHEIRDGFGLDVIDAASISDPNTAASGLSAAANVGLLISSAAAGDAHYVAILHVLAQGLPRAQLIVVDADARAALSFLPESWPAMSLDDARTRSAELVRRRDAVATEGPEHAAPVPTPQPEPTPAPEPEAPPPIDEPQPDPGEAPASAEAPDGVDNAAENEHAPAVEQEETTSPTLSVPQGEPDPHQEVGAAGAAGPPRLGDEQSHEEDAVAFPSNASPEETPVAAAPPTPLQPAPMPSAPPQAQASEADAPPKTRSRAAVTVPADATAFAPKKLRRGTPEVVQIAIHQPKDLKAVIKSAKQLDPRTEPAPQGMSVGDIAIGASVAVSLEARGGTCIGELQRRAWTGDPLNFIFSFEANDAAKQAVFFARVFVNDAQIGAIAFQRPISGAAKKPASAGDGARLKRYKRVFISYSAKDRETVAAIATAYRSAGVEHFWDRASLKSGEEWSPRLRKEIDRADLFHLCWSKSAAGSEWVEKETEHALTRRKRSNGKNPDITVQMLDGPPWAPHPAQLDAINFDDFVRAAIVGYARGDGST